MKKVIAKAGIKREKGIDIVFCDKLKVLKRNESKLNDFVE